MKVSMRLIERRGCESEVMIVGKQAYVGDDVHIPLELAAGRRLDDLVAIGVAGKVNGMVRLVIHESTVSLRKIG
jgi:hypothetical protein